MERHYRTGLHTLVREPASWARRVLWRGVCRLVGGLVVRGRLDAGPGGRIVVANHGSHADTAALLAALPAAARPVFVAAADYWFAVPLRRAVASGLAGILPVRRGRDGAYPALLDAVRPMLADGRTVVIYPEGTRSTDGRVGTFRSGALRLARDCRVPIVPVAVLGTRDVLPKNGRLHRARMEVRIGTAQDAATLTAKALRSEIVAMREDRVERNGAASGAERAHLRSHVLRIRAQVEAAEDQQAFLATRRADRVDLQERALAAEAPDAHHAHVLNERPREMAGAEHPADGQTVGIDAQARTGPGPEDRGDKQPDGGDPREQEPGRIRPVRPTGRKPADGRRSPDPSTGDKPANRTPFL